MTDANRRRNSLRSSALRRLTGDPGSFGYRPAALVMTASRSTRAT